MYIPHNQQKFVEAVNSWRYNTPRSMLSNSCVGSDNIDSCQGSQYVIERITRELAAEEEVILKRLNDEKCKLLSEISTPIQMIQIDVAETDAATIRYENELRELEEMYVREFYGGPFDRFTYETKSVSPKCAITEAFVLSLEPFNGSETIYYIQE